MKRLPTEKQYDALLTLGSGAMVVSGGDRRLRAMVKRGWLASDRPEWPDNGFRLTVAGFRALADAVEKYGLPKMGRRPETRVRVCVDCGSTRYRYESRPAEMAA